MNNELTREDIRKMQEELEERRLVTRPKIMEDVVRARSFGDLSENDEYKTAKKMQRENDARVRYLERMIKTATIIEDTSSSDEVGLYDLVGIYMPEDDETVTLSVVTTVRVDPGKGFISKESPLGQQLLGKKVGVSFTVRVSDTYSYEAKVVSIEKGEDDGSAPLLSH